jgi:hypothetical protein
VYRRWSRGHDLLLCQREGVKEGLHRGLAEAPTALMGSLLVVQSDKITPIRSRYWRFSTRGIRGSGALFISMR